MAPATVAFTLLVVAATCLAKNVYSGSFLDRDDRRNTLSTHLYSRLKSTAADYRFLPPRPGLSDVENGDNLQLLDIVLVASVDGRFHALNRTSGQTLWSMASSATSPIPSALAPLVRTVHVETDPDVTDEDSPHQEIYIIEPQSGDIYVMSSPESPLQRLPFSMAQLVDMSPFSFAGDDDRRVFVGRKETSLISVQLATGKVMGAINTACPWDPLENIAGKCDLDSGMEDLDHAEIMCTPSPEVFIGRTDYFIAIHTRPSPSVPNPPVQNLSFSVYGPNNQDNTLQSTYRRTADDAYIQSLPNGNIISFRAKGVQNSDHVAEHSSQLLWAHTFDSPVVAVFDVVKTVGRQQPFVLLQPQARLQDVMPNIDFQRAARSEHLPNLHSAYVGLIEETGSLFAMSPDRFPLIVFSDANQDETTIDSSEAAMSILDSSNGVRTSGPLCRTGSANRTCLTGVRRLEESSRSRLSRLLDGAPSVAPPPPHDVNWPSDVVTEQPPFSLETRDTPAILPSWIWFSEAKSLIDGNQLPRLNMSTTLSSASSFLLALLFAAFWIFRRMTRTVAASTSHEASRQPERETADIKVPSGDSASDFSQPATTTSAATDAPPNRTDHPPEADTVPNGVSFDSQDDQVDAEESDKENDPPPVPGKRKVLRRKRGKRKKAIPNGLPLEDGEHGGNDLAEEVVGAPLATPSLATPPLTTPPLITEPVKTPIILPSPPQPSVPNTSLIVSDTILGFGSHGTVVFRGSFQGRAVAVKRLLQDFVTLASREVNVLQESDDHPNVIRYYYQEAHADFLYIALELCPASLADVIESPDQFRDISIAFDPKRALKEITSGLRHLHGLKIIHRDIKPQNILISGAKQGTGRYNAHRMLISDFGLCKKLDVDQTSFLPTANGALGAGTVGWRAPEILRGEVKLDESIGDDQSLSSQGSTGTAYGSGAKPSQTSTRLTKFVDIFALGCLFYYTLTGGNHPYGDRFEREVNILKGAQNLSGLGRFGEEGSEGTNLIGAMLSPEAYQRPDTSTCLLHPYFWTPARRLNFLQDASDRFEIMCREPRDPNLTILEQDAAIILGADWHTRLDKVFVENLGKFRKYDGRSVQDLLRALRNKKHHYQDLPDNVKRTLGPMPDGFLNYFTRRFPALFLHVHSVIASTSLRTEPMFRSYFDVTD